MPRKALVPARAALRFAHQAAGKCGAAQPFRRWNQTLALAGGCIAVPGFGGHSDSVWRVDGRSIRYQVSHADTSREIDSQKRGRLNRGLVPTILPAQCVATSRRSTAPWADRSTR